MITEFLVNCFRVGVEVGAFEDSDAVWVCGVSLDGEFVKCGDDGCFLLFVGKLMGWVEKGNTDIQSGWFADDALFGEFIGGCSSEGGPG